MKKTIELCEFKKGMKVIDIGCGRKELRKYIPKEVKYIGIDKEETNLNKKKTKIN